MFADPGGVIRTVGRYDTANSVWLLQHRLTDEFGNLYALVGDVAGLADAYHTQGYFMTEYNQRPLAVRLLFVAVAVICFGQAYRIAAAVGGRAEAAAVAQTSAVSAANLPRYVEKPIEEIRAGDLVLARNEVTGELASKHVVRTFQRTSDHIRELTIRSSLGGLQTIETTDEHPFWVTDSGWVPAAQLSPGAKLLDSHGGTSTLVASTHIPRSHGVPVCQGGYRLQWRFTAFVT